mgnify:CR=1 FL=1
MVICYFFVSDVRCFFDFKLMFINKTSIIGLNMSPKFNFAISLERQIDKNASSLIKNKLGLFKWVKN